MPAVLDTVLKAVGAGRSSGPRCFACGLPIAPGEEAMRLRRGVVMHRSCATYEIRRRRTGDARLGYPPR